MKVTRKSHFSGIERTRELNITPKQMDLYLEGNIHIQGVFPELSNSDREFIKTGITDEEWNEMFGVDELVEQRKVVLLKLWDTATPAREQNPTSCPNCHIFCTNQHDNPTSFLDKDETEFIEAPDPHYQWNELHKCLHCDTVYTIVNGT